MTIISLLVKNSVNGLPIHTYVPLEKNQIRLFNLRSAAAAPQRRPFMAMLPRLTLKQTLKEASTMLYPIRRAIVRLRTQLKSTNAEY